MVTLNRIYTRTGDKGRTRLATGSSIAKSNVRVEAYGTVDETNSAIGLARLYLRANPTLNVIFGRIQNDLFDVGADLATPGQPDQALRIISVQVKRLEDEIDQLNADLSPLTSFILPGGTAAAAALHLARTVCRRAERCVVQLADVDGEVVNNQTMQYLNRLSDLLFVAARWANAKGADDVLWAPGGTQ